MSKPNWWKMEWSFFLADNGRKTYNDVCRACIHDCNKVLGQFYYSVRGMYLKGQKM